MSRTTTIETANYTIILVKRRYDDKTSKTRIFVDGQGDPEMERPPYDRYDEKTGERIAFDAEWRKYNREEVKMMRAHLEPALEELDEFLEVQDPGKVRFSRKAGCSMCPCSPGFVAEDLMWIELDDSATPLSSIHILEKANEELADDEPRLTPEGAADLDFESSTDC